MIRLNKDQQNKIAGIAVGTVVAIVGLYLGLISFQQSALAIARDRVNKVQAKVSEASAFIKLKQEYQNAVDKRAEMLEEIESKMVVGDAYSWSVKVVNQFRAPYKIDVPNISQAQSIPAGILPNFPYQAVMFKIKANGYYHELGRFLTDFENQHPYMRVQNISLEPAKTSASDESENVEAILEVVALIKPAATR